MKGFIENVNQIREICNDHANCYGCPFLDIRVKYPECYLQGIPEGWNPLEILDRIAKWKGGEPRD